MVTQARVGNSVFRSGIQAYVRTRVEGSSGIDLLLAAYDMAIASCAREDDVTAAHCLAELINALNFAYDEVATGLFRLYRYCLDLVKTQRWQEAAAILRHLRQTWAEAAGEPLLQIVKN